jgi:hypothetical protein
VGAGSAGADITVIARFDGMPGAQDLDAADFWFDRDLALSAQDGISALDVDPSNPSGAGVSSAQPADGEAALDAADAPTDAADAAAAEVSAYEHAALSRWSYAGFQAFEI